MNRVRLVALLCIAFAAAPLSAQAPARPVRLVVASAPGTTLDQVARAIAPKLGESLGQPVTVDNRPGSNGATAAEAVAKAPLDGSTLLLATPSLAALVALSAKLPFDGINAFAPVGRVATEPLVLVATGTLPVSSLADLIAVAKASPGRMNYASAGAGSGSHLAMELLKSATTIQLAHAPATSNDAALADVAAGRAQLYFGSLPTVEPAVRAGKVRALAIAGPAALPRLPDVPTLAQQGFVDYDFVNWFGVFAPAGTPKAVVLRINGDLTKAVAASGVRDQLTQMLGTEPRVSTPDELAARVKREIATFERLGRELNIRLE